MDNFTLGFIFIMLALVGVFTYVGIVYVVPLQAQIDAELDKNCRIQHFFDNNFMPCESRGVRPN
jgi:hypothetical protein